MPRRKEKTVIRNGIEYYYKSIRDERGKYITVYGRTIAERDEKVKKREAEIRLRRKIKEFPTFSERATEWLSDKSADLKRNTYNNYEQIIRTHFIPVLGDKRLIDITGCSRGAVRVRLSQGFYANQTDFCRCPHL